MVRREGFIRGLAAGIGLAAAAAGGLVYLQYRRQLQEAEERVYFGSWLAKTACGPIEYGAVGSGSPVLVVHGAGGGYDQGLSLAEDFIGDGFRYIAPSRFGYLRTPLPEDASVATQAEAHACLLDALDIPRVAVVGASAGAPSSLQFALQYPERVSALVLLVPGLYAPSARASESPPLPECVYSALLSTDLPFWLTLQANPSSIVTWLLATPPEVQARMKPEEQERVQRLLRTILPIHSRKAGILNDARAIPAQGRLPLEEVGVPALLISARDDLYNTYPAAEYTAQHIPGARFIGFESGGHIMAGHEEKVRSAVTAFLREPQPPPREDSAA